MEIRTLTPNDAQIYFRLRLEALQHYPEAFAASYEEEKNSKTAEDYVYRFQESDSITVGAFDEDQLVGSVTLIREKLEKLKHKAHIVAMYVTPIWQSRGIGKALLINILSQAKAIEGIEQIFISVVSTNEPAKRLYQTLGFEIWATEKNALKVDDLYYDEIHMALYLN